MNLNFEVNLLRSTKTKLKIFNLIKFNKHKTQFEKYMYYEGKIFLC